MASEQAAQAWHQAGQDGLRMTDGGGEARLRDVHEQLPVLEIVMDDTQAISQRLWVLRGLRQVPGEPDCVDVAKS
ncbi:hypothetical protein UB43_00660 [Pseudomonas sp. 21]|nr:hypothetical protein UB43_00660 [Pseudomonas sp. 21]